MNENAVRKSSWYVWVTVWSMSDNSSSSVWVTGSGVRDSLRREGVLSVSNNEVT